MLLQGEFRPRGSPHTPQGRGNLFHSATGQGKLWGTPAEEQPQEETKRGCCVAAWDLGVGLCMGADGAWISWVLAHPASQRKQY